MTARRARRAPRLDFEVTQAHIDESTRRDSSHCMIADALRDAIPTATFISVDLATIRFTDEAAGYRYIYLTPGYAQKALLDFDQGQKPDPFRLRQNAAQMTLTGGARRARAVRNKQVEEETGVRPPAEATVLIPPRHNAGNSVPIKHGGEPIPKGPLSGTAHRDGTAPRRGKRREFGIRRFAK